MGIGAKGIATKLGVKVNGVDLKTIKGFLFVLKEVYKGCLVSEARLQQTATKLKVADLLADQ